MPLLDTRPAPPARHGASRTTLQRIARDSRAVPLDPERALAGTWPLPPGHALSWCAISAHAFEPEDGR